MKRKIFILRHGKPLFTAARVCCIGHTDIPLSEEGIKQIKKLKKWFDAQDIKQVYSSPLRRCTASAALISDKYEICTGLQEVDMGQWENLTFDEIKERFPEEYRKRGEQMGYYAPPGGESFHQAGERFERILKDIIGETEDNILIVTHAGITRGYLCRNQGVSANEVFCYPQPYAGITELTEERNSLSIEKIGYRPLECLDDEEIRHFYESCHTPERVIRHMKKVAEFLERLLECLPKEAIESRENEDVKELLLKAALLHDITRTEEKHEETAARILEKEGYPDIAKLVSGHHGRRLDQVSGREKLTLDELLVYADKRVQENRIVTVEERFETSLKKCKTEQAQVKHRNLYNKTKEIEDKIKKSLLYKM